MGDINSKSRKTLCSFIAIIIASCIALSVSAIVSSGVLKSQEFVEKRMLKCNSILLDAVVKANEEIMPANSNFPVKAFTDSVGEGHINTALKQVSGSLVYGYKTDFSNSSYLYSYYRTGLMSYCNRNGIPIDSHMEDVISRDSSFAVDVFNSVCGDESTNFIIPFQEAQSNDPLKTSFACLVIIAICAFIIKRLNYGDYFMFSYGAMSVITAGAIMIILPLFALAMDYSSLFNFTDVEAYNIGIKYCMEDVLKILAGTGGVLTLVGIISMNVVYNRYNNIVTNIQTEMVIAEKLRKEYMEEQLKFELDNGIIRNDDAQLANNSQDDTHYNIIHQSQDKIENNNSDVNKVIAKFNNVANSNNRLHKNKNKNKN